MLIGIWMLGIGAAGVFIAGHWAIWTANDVTTLTRFFGSALWTFVAGMLVAAVQADS